MTTEAGEVNESDIGAAVLRLQHDAASENDTVQITNRVVSSNEFRARCSLIGAMARNFTPDEGTRQECAEALCHIMFLKSLPAEPPGDGDWVAVTGVFIVQSSPMEGSPWATHIEGVYTKTGGLSDGKLSPYATRCVRAIEEMWGVSGHLLPLATMATTVA